MLSETQVDGIAGGLALRVVESATGREGVAIRVSPPSGENGEFIVVEWDGFPASYSYVKRADLEVVG